MIIGQYDEIHACLKSLEYPFESCVKDLRSQVVRECCITIAFISQTLRNKVTSKLFFRNLILIRNICYFAQKKVKIVLVPVQCPFLPNLSQKYDLTDI